MAITSISIIAPSSWFSPESFQAGINTLNEWGITCKIPDNIFDRKHRYLAGSEEQRLEEIHQALADPETQLIMAARGGYGSMHLLNKVNIDLLRETGKPIVGFSDITALHALWFKHAIPSFHGTNVTTINQMDYQSLDNFKMFLKTGKPSKEIRGTGGHGISARGCLVGGNLALLSSLCGSSHQFDFYEGIVFIEEVGERPYRLDRMLTQLDYSGVWNNISGVVLGEFRACNPVVADGKDYSGEQVLIDFFSQRNIPIAWGFPFGHGNTQRILPYGQTVTLDTAQARLLLHEES